MVVKEVLKWVVKKALTAINTAFFGYEIGSYMNDEQKQETVYNTTIIQSAQGENQSDAHFYIVIGFLFLIIFLLCLVWVLKIVIRVKTKGNNQIELTAIPAATNSPV